MYDVNCSAGICWVPLNGPAHARIVVPALVVRTAVIGRMKS